MKKIIFTALLFSLLLASCSSGEKAQLRFALEKDHTYTTSMTTKTSMQQSIQDMSFDIDMVLSADIDFQVTDATEDTYSMDIRYTGLRMEMNSPMFSMGINTDEGDANPMSAMFRGMTKSSFHAKMTNRGEMIEVTGLDAVITGMLDGVPDMDAAQKAQMAEQMNSSYGKDSFKGNVEMMNAMFPEKPVGPGDKWNAEIELSSQGNKMKVDTEYTYVKDEGDYRIITSKSTITSLHSGTDAMGAGLDLSGTMDTTLKVDKVTGWTMEGAMKQELEGKMSLGGEASGTLKMVSDITFVSTK